MDQDASAIDVPDGIDPLIPALGVRQPWAELILRGIKTLEVRSSLTSVRGMIYLYSSKVLADVPDARLQVQRHQLPLEELPRGLLIGSVAILGARPATADDAGAACVSPALLDGKCVWELSHPRRFDSPCPVRFLPYGLWFYPYRRKGATGRSTAAD